MVSHRYTRSHLIFHLQYRIVSQKENQRIAFHFEVCRGPRPCGNRYMLATCKIHEIALKSFFAGACAFQVIYGMHFLVGALFSVQHLSNWFSCISLFCSLGVFTKFRNRKSWPTENKEQKTIRNRIWAFQLVNKVLIIVKFRKIFHEDKMHTNTERGKSEVKCDPTPMCFNFGHLWLTKNLISPSKILNLNQLLSYDIDFNVYIVTHLLLHLSRAKDGEERVSK